MDASDFKSADELMPAVYEELRRLAASKLSNESAGHTLQPTALVHEAWLRIVSGRDQKFVNRSHFFAAAAEAMRRILIERARQRHALRHGGNQQRVNIADIDPPMPAEDDRMIAISESLDKLAESRPVEAELVKLRYFVGMTNDEAAAVLGISVRTAKNYWAHARAWLYQSISSDGID